MSLPAGVVVSAQASPNDLNVAPALPIALGDSWADTTTPAGKLMLTVLGGLAEYERHLILSRTAEGRSRAQASGVRFGRKPSLTPYQRTEALRRRTEGETLTEIARSMNVSHMTIARATTNGSGE